MKPVCAAAALSLFLPACAFAAGRQASPAAVQTILAVPLENAGRAASLSWLSEGLARVTEQRMGGPNRIVLPREEWLAAAERLGLAPSPRLSHASLLKIAQEVDADYVVFGSFTAAAGRLTITAQGIRLDGPAISPPFTESGPLEQALETHARACWELLRFFDPTLPVSRQAYLQQSPRLRMDAFEHYSRGMLASGPDRVRMLREATRLEPDWPDASFELGRAYLEAGSYDPALIWFSRVPPASTAGLEAGFYAGVCHLRRNDAPRAEAAFRAILERPWYPGERSAPAARRMDLPEVLNNLAIALSRQGKWNEARPLWGQARLLAPVEPAFAFNLALGAFRAGEFAAAAQALREALRVRPDDDARALLVAALQRAGNKAEADAERAACANGANGVCAASNEMKALLAQGASPSAAVRLDRISGSLDLLTWFLTGQSREPPGSASAVREPHPIRQRRVSPPESRL